MQAHEIIRPLTSPWASPVVLVRKKNGTLQCCVDYRALNTFTKPDVFTISRTDDLLDQPGQCTIFSTLDHAAGYWPIKVHPDSQEKTAFTSEQTFAADALWVDGWALLWPHDCISLVCGGGMACTAMQ